MTDHELRAYLLGQSAPDDAARLEERLLEDQDVFDALRGMEDDLFDEYARGRLTADERRQFLARYGGQTERLAFADALARRASSPTKVLPFRGLTRREWVPLAAAAALVAAVGGFWIARRNLPDENRAAQRVIPRETTAPGRPEQPPAAMPPFVALIALGTSRAASASDARIALPNGASIVELRVRLDPADRFDRYTMELRSSSNAVVWRSDDLRASSDGGDLLAVGRMSAAAVTDGSYELTVRGGSAKGALEDLGFVTVKVTRTP